MNVNDVDMNGEASGSNADQNSDRLTNSPKHNDCGKHCSIAVGGARPKVRQLVCNIPNGVAPHITDDSAKVNNNVLLNETCEDADNKSDTSMGLPVNKVHNGLNLNRSNGAEATNGMDSYLRNNVNFNTSVDKCPLKVRSCSVKDNNLASFSASSNGYQNLETCDVANMRWKDDDSSSDTGNEGEDGLSADEFCIYTYKGDQMADLPSSFFRLDVLAGGDQSGTGEGSRGRWEEGDDRHNSGGSSPEMDFLEMDFDPGPSCEQDSDEEFDHDLREEVAFPDLDNHLEEPPVELENRGEQEARNDLSAVASSHNNELDSVTVPAQSPSSPEQQQTPHEDVCGTTTQQPPLVISHSRSSDANLGSAVLHRSTTTCWPARDVWGHHCTSGDLCSPGDAATDGDSEPWSETLAMWNAGNLRIQGDGLLDTRKYNLHSALYHCIMAKRLVLDKQASFSESDESNMEGRLDESPDGFRSPVERTMIWSEQEACVKQVTQISTSACGATAVINVLLALNIPFSLDKVKEGVATRLRSDCAALPEYLFSRSVAGATHVDIIRSLEYASEGTLYARFFHLYPDRVISLTRWLTYWMKKGAIPVATLNLQHGVAPGNPVPDAWHHQMVFGVGPRGVYLTNPLECVREGALWPQLSSPSMLLVRRADILSRWNEHTNLCPLMVHPDQRWKRMNVLGQVVNVLRESTCSQPQSQGRVITQHVAIPAAYCSGITLAISRESPGYEELRSTQDLLLLQQH